MVDNESRTVQGLRGVFIIRIPRPERHRLFRHLLDPQSELRGRYPTPLFDMGYEGRMHPDQYRKGLVCDSVLLLPSIKFVIHGWEDYSHIDCLSSPK